MSGQRLLPPPGLALAAVWSGAVGALAPAIWLADPTPGLAAAAARGVAGWLVAAGPVLLLVVAWRLARDRELGRRQVAFVAGSPLRAQVATALRTAAGQAAAAVVPAALGGALAAGGAQRHAGSALHLGWSHPPSAAFAFGSLGVAACGLLVGAIAGVAATTRRQLAVAAAGSFVLSVTVLVLRPFSPTATRLAVWTPTGGIWPVTLGWSLDRWFAVDDSMARRATSLAAWVALVALVAARRARQGGCLRSGAVADRP